MKYAHELQRKPDQPQPKPSAEAIEMAKTLASTSCVHGFRYDDNGSRFVAMDCLECVALALDKALRKGKPTCE